MEGEVVVGGKNETQPIMTGSRVRFRSAAFLNPKHHKFALCRGVVVDVPVYPNTWFTVLTTSPETAYSSRHLKLVKVRVSAFDLLSTCRKRKKAEEKVWGMSDGL
eukprot:TRINITY_DN7967_c0_g1_i1.p1 TRINITY_DN7967_c0_g1~~TRINITY_DN7967_c0_g1_i1.p1  ORF type:complete len:105 (-),score=21.75 TRINITY_DN7967_c0_g1_i1:46-360(-)